MKSDVAGIGEILERVQSLEKENRRLWKLVLVIVVLGGSLLLMAQVPQRKTVEGTEFVLRDSDGRLRARLAVDEAPWKEKVAKLVLFDERGSEVVEIGTGFLSLGGGRIVLSDEQGKRRVSLSANSRLGGTLSLLDDKGVPGNLLHTSQARLQNVEMGDSSLTLTGEKGKRLSLSAGMILIDHVRERQLVPGADLLASMSKIKEHVEGGPIVSLSDAGLSISDARGFGAMIGNAELTTPGTGETHKRSAASIVLVDHNQNVLWKVP